MVQNYDPSKAFGEGGGDIEAWRKQAREWWNDSFAPEPEEALRVARMALEGAVSDNDIREAADAACYIVHTCRPTVREEDEEVDEDELDDDTKSLVRLFEGGTVVKLAPPPFSEDDEIPFEAPRIETAWAKMRADLAASEARWAEWRASADHAAGRSPEHECPIAA